MSRRWCRGETHKPTWTRSSSWHETRDSGDFPAVGIGHTGQERPSSRNGWGRQSPAPGIGSSPYTLCRRHSTKTLPLRVIRIVLIFIFSRRGFTFPRTSVSASAARSLDLSPSFSTTEKMRVFLPLPPTDLGASTTGTVTGGGPLRFFLGCLEPTAWGYEIPCVGLADFAAGAVLRCLGWAHGLAQKVQVHTHCFKNLTNKKRRRTRTEVQVPHRLTSLVSRKKEPCLNYSKSIRIAYAIKEPKCGPRFQQRKQKDRIAFERLSPKFCESWGQRHFVQRVNGFGQGVP